MAVRSRQTNSARLLCGEAAGQRRSRDAPVKNRKFGCFGPPAEPHVTGAQDRLPKTNEEDQPTMSSSKAIMLDELKPNLLGVDKFITEESKKSRLRNARARVNVDTIGREKLQPIIRALKRHSTAGLSII
jgi:hypothetical protein